MKSNLITIVIPASIAAGLLLGCNSASITERTNPARPSRVQASEGYDTFGRKWEVYRRSESARLTYTGTITAIDYAQREMTLKDSSGGLDTFYVSRSVQRFNEAKVGDKVSMDYYLGMDAEVRPPTNEERANPLEVMDATRVRSSSDTAPSGYDMRRIRAVVTIEAIDKAANTFTVRGPRGQYYTATAKDPSRLDKVRVGDSILITFTEATVVTLTKM